METTGRQSNDISKRRWPRPLAGLQGLEPSGLLREASAGVTLAALIVPLNIGYAQVAGLPPSMGLYSAIFPLVLFALFTSSRHVVGGPGPATAALVAAALAGFAAPGDPARMQYALALALICSLLFFLAWLFRLAFLQNFLSGAVLTGFVSGLGVVVFTHQLHHIMGVSVDVSSQLNAFGEQVQHSVGMSLATQGYFLDVAALAREIPHANLYAVAIGLGSFIGVRLMKRYAPKIPGALVVLAVMTTVVVAFDLDTKGVSVLGQLPPGLPVLGLPAMTPGEYLQLLPGAFAIVAITLCEGLLLARGYAQQYGYKVEGNQMLFAYGMANAAAGVSGSLVTGNSVSRSAAMASAGASTQLTSLVAAGVVAVTLAFFTPLLALLPSAALAGLVANAVLALIKVSDLRELFRARRSEFWVAMICLLSVLILGPMRAVLIAFTMSVIDLLRRSSAPATTVLLPSAHGDHFVSPNEGAGASIPGVIVYRFSASLYFANAHVLAEQMAQLLATAPAPVKWVVLDASAMADMDTTGADTLRQVLEELSATGVTLAVSRADEQLKRSMNASGIFNAIGADHFFDTNREAVAAFSRI